MPELPEVEHLRRTLAPLIGRRVARAELMRTDIAQLAERHPDVEPSAAPATASAHASAMLAGARIEALHRHGKQLAIKAEDGRALVVQLGMTGALLICTAGQPTRPHTHARWLLDDKSELAFIDPRRFGRLTPAPTPESLRGLWAALGPDALSVTPAQLRRALAGTRQAVKAALLDQHRLAGVGNIYADEALFDAGIDPRRAGGSLDADDCARLSASVRRVLRRAIRLGGSSIRTYRDSRGNPGRQQESLRVYGRGGEPCVRCATRLQAGRIAQRATVWCPTCQAPGGVHGAPG